MRKWKVSFLTLAIGAAMLGCGDDAADNSPSSFAAPFEVEKLTYSFGQGPSWTGDGEVLSTQFDAAGVTQIYRARTDGSDQRCLTCDTVAGPNGLPSERPQGDWILFHSYGQQPIHFGAPGFGGYGGDLYVMRADGSDPYRLTTNSNPADGAPYSIDGVAYDNFHAYWSPDGTHLIWTHTEAHPMADGGQAWTILLGDFEVTNGRPALVNVRVVAKPYGAYETQPWSPDGKGFLFSAAGGLNSPHQPEPPGWGNMRLYYMRLFGDGASPEEPLVTLLSDNTPVYEEQAIFTPDMKAVIVMSNRAATLGSWYTAVAAAAQRTRFDAPNTGPTQTLQFIADFSGQDFRADLFIVDVETLAIRRLTYIDEVIPEFFWDPSYERIIWSLGGAFNSDTYVGSFQDLGPESRRVPTDTPPALWGAPVDMSRVGTQAQAVRDPGPTHNTAVPVSPPRNPAPAFPHALQSSDVVTVPNVVLRYVEVWRADLAALGEAAEETFTTDPLERLLGQQ